MALGHRLLQPQDALRAEVRKRKVRVAIVGAGPAGLSAAWRLEQLGVDDFVICDLESAAGGTSVHGEDGAVPYPWGAHYVPLPGPRNRALKLLLEEVDAATPGDDGALNPKERVLIREPEERLFIDGQWQPGLFPRLGATDGDLAELERFEKEVRHWVAFRDRQGRRAFTLPARHASTAPELRSLDRLTGAQWFRERGLRSQRLYWYLELGCRDDYGLTMEQVSAWALLFYHCARRGDFGAGSAPFVTWPEGNGRLVKHLAKGVGSRLHLGRLVTKLSLQPEGVTLTLLDPKRERLEQLTADYAIAAVPDFILSRIVVPGSAPIAAGSRFPGFSYAPWLVVNLHLRQVPASYEPPGAWDNVLYDSPSLGYVVAGHQTARDIGPNVWTYFLPLVGSDPALERRRLQQLTQPEIVKQALQDLSGPHPDLRRYLERADVYRWAHAMVRPVPGFRSSPEREALETPRGRLYRAHSDLSGVALFEEAQDRGVLAAEAIARSMGLRVEALNG